MMRRYEAEAVFAAIAGKANPTCPAAARGAQVANLVEVLTMVAEEEREAAACDVPRDTARFDAAELRSRGEAGAAERALQQALEWYRSCPEEERERYRADFARTLYEAECWEEARRIFDELAAEQPENVGYAGHRATLAARRGDRQEAEGIEKLLACTRQRYLFGAHTLWRARIAAQLGQRRQALRLLQEALAQGQPNGVWLLLDPDLAPLRGSRVFRRLIRGTRLPAAPRRDW